MKKHFPLQGHPVLICICTSFLLGFSLMSCSPEESPEPKIDDEWDYICTTYDTLGNITGSSTVTLRGYTSSQNPSWVVIGPVPEAYSINVPCGTYKMKENGLHRSICGTQLCYKDIFLKNTGEPSEEYLSYSMMGVEEYTDIVNMSDTVTVPMGFFDHVKVYKTKMGTSNTGKIWFDDEAWFVRYEVYRSESYPYPISMVWELADYRPM